ncbi:hypothetical protein [Inquilinus sp. CAU 1745]|uniref:hypothetical protein n=1 Tax=Inquilinus sp. CAU 1745 TaxID=3140369 RepID=UPI00325AB4CF
MLEIDMLGPRPVDEDDNRLLIQALDAMEDAGDDLAQAVVHARWALEIDPACASAMLVLAENARNRAERIALLKEVVSIGKREVAPESDFHINNTRVIMTALAELGDELSAVGDVDGAANCLRLLLDMEPQDRLEARIALERIEGGGLALRP